MELTIDEINNLANNNDVLIARNDKLVKVLEEIREIINGDLKSVINSCGRGMEYIEDSLDKINEVLNELHN